jgi:hypothetical protein
MMDDYSKNYRPIPRTMNQAFGPYAKLDEIAVCRRRERLCAIVGVLIVGVIYGLLFVWRG